VGPRGRAGTHLGRVQREGLCGRVQRPDSTGGHNGDAVVASHRLRPELHVVVGVQEGEGVRRGMGSELWREDP